MAMNDRMYTRATTVCFTGHRPEKLPDGGDENSAAVRALKSMLYKSILDSIDDGYNCFITGAARGIDLWAAEIIISEKNSGKDISLVAAIPYKDHGIGFKGYDKWVLGNIYQKADEIVYVSDSYSKTCMKKRNEYMVKNSSRLIAVLGDYRSGSGQTVRLAQKENIDIIIIDTNNVSEAADLIKSAQLEFDIT